MTASNASTAAAVTDAPAQEKVQAPAANYYPETVSPLRAQLPVVNREFAELREAFLLGFSERTAMAYWGDLDQFHDWCQQQNLDVLSVRGSDVQSFLDQQARTGYSANTVARRLTSLRGFFALVAGVGRISMSPTVDVLTIQRPIQAAEHGRRRSAARARIADRRLRNRDYDALLKRVSDGKSCHAQIRGLLLADGLSPAQVSRISEDDISADEHGVSLCVVDKHVKVTVRLRLPEYAMALLTTTVTGRRL